MESSAATTASAPARKAAVGPKYHVFAKNANGAWSLVTKETNPVSVSPSMREDAKRREAIEQAIKGSDYEEGSAEFFVFRAEGCDIVKRKASLQPVAEYS